MGVSETKTLPGSTGLPMLGETLSFLQNNFAFLQDRVKTHGPVFKTSLLGRPTAVLSGPDACDVFLNPQYIVRENSMPPHVGQLFGGASLPLLDGAEHLARKTLVLQAFTPSALMAYLPTMEAIMARSMGEWEKAGEFRAIDAFKRVAIEIICTNVMSLAPGPEMDAVIENYGAVTGGFATLPINLPGLPFNRALKARDSLFALYDRIISEHQAHPSQDGLSRMLGASTEDGKRLDAAQARQETHHVVLAGYIVFGEFAGLVLELSRREDLVKRLATEADGLPPGPMTEAGLRSLPIMMQVIQETKRVTPVVPVSFGICKNSFEYKGHTIPAGWMVILSLPTINKDATSFTDPDRFDPERFSPERAEHKRHPHAFVPQGHGPPTGHLCAGVDYSTLFMQVFLVHLLRGYTWELPPQNLEYEWGLLPPEPKDGLRIKLRRRVK